jgi:hypothetical protein
MAKAAKNSARVINSWNFSEGRLMKCMATHLYDSGLRGQALLSAFEKLVPNWKQYFQKPISDEALLQRADKARRYANENPETNPRLKRYWQPAGAAVRRRECLLPRAFDLPRRWTRRRPLLREPKEGAKGS